MMGVYGAGGGEIFALRRPRPYSRRWGEALRPLPPINDAARRVATVFDKSNCMIETSLPKRRGKATNKRLNPYGGLGGGFAALARASTRAGGRATLGPPLQHRPYQECNSQSRQLIDM